MHGQFFRLITVRYTFSFLKEQIYKNKKARVSKKNKNKWKNWL